MSALPAASQDASANAPVPALDLDAANALLATLSP